MRLSGLIQPAAVWKIMFGSITPPMILESFSNMGTMGSYFVVFFFLTPIHALFNEKKW